MHHQIVRFTLPTNGGSKTIKLTDGTILTVRATRPVRCGGAQCAECVAVKRCLSNAANTYANQAIAVNCRAVAGH
ncbi:hypothetical protein BGZ97_007592 [Linnemannia gamsii]|uniref:Uncharacterized protein n=1 Tax=Linnemannia gamsii TaxID=64522 RepID=A0A9P6RF38_9FUNG|nr:hypothetical protein BGZ97_007592 [Linnemannia gamsii]